MKSCNVDAGTQKLAGDARKTFMADCVAGRATAAPEKELTPQQAKMKSCNADQDEELQCRRLGEEPDGRRPQGLHELLPEGVGVCPAEPPGAPHYLEAATSAPRDCSA